MEDPSDPRSLLEPKEVEIIHGKLSRYAFKVLRSKKMSEAEAFDLSNDLVNEAMCRKEEGTRTGSYAGVVKSLIYNMFRARQAEERRHTAYKHEFGVHTQRKDFTSPQERALQKEDSVRVLWNAIRGEGPKFFEDFKKTVDQALVKGAGTDLEIASRTGLSWNRVRTVRERVAELQKQLVKEEII